MTQSVPANWSLIIGFGFLLFGNQPGAVIMFLLALVAMVNRLPTGTCCHHCKQGRDCEATKDGAG